MIIFDVYFIIGALGAGGRVSKNGLFIAVDMFSQTENSPMDSLAYGLVPIDYINRSRFTIAFFRCLYFPTLTVFAHHSEHTKRIYRKRLISLHFILHWSRKPFFYFLRSRLAFTWLAWYYHTLFNFIVDISVNNVDYYVERKRYRNRTSMIATSKIVKGPSSNNANSTHQPPAASGG